mgnify:CR=1 FL=1
MATRQAGQTQHDSEDGGSALPHQPLCSCVTDCAEVLKALADANRVLIVRALLSQALNVSAISASTGLPQQRVSHHLARLRLSGIVEPERDGRSVVYRISPDIACDGGLDIGCCRLSFRPLPQLRL